MEPKLVEQYVGSGSVKLEYRDYAFLGPESDLAAEAGVCAEEQNKFWRFHDTIFANQGRENAGDVTPARLRAMAEASGLEMTAFDKCVASDRPQQQVAASLAEAKQQGINSTPTLFVNGQQTSGFDWATVQQTIEDALANQSG